MLDEIAADQLLNRYLRGEHEAVWADMMSLGVGVRSEPYLTPALAVCHEMVRRSRENLITLFRRLDAIGFEFWDGQEGLYRMTSQEVAEPDVYIFGPPTKLDNAHYINDTNHANADMLFPLSLQVWGKEIGGVGLLGSHPTLCPFYDNEDHPAIYADPFEVILFFDPDGEPLDGFGENAGSRLIISPTDDFKAECSFYEQIPNTYGMRLPNPGVDAKLEGIWYDTTFVGYLRKNFQWGGFPGWERYSSRPEKELEYLREGLLPI